MKPHALWPGLGLGGHPKFRHPSGPAPCTPLLWKPVVWEVGCCQEALALSAPPAPPSPLWVPGPFVLAQTTQLSISTSTD